MCFRVGVGLNFTSRSNENLGSTLTQDIALEKCYKIQTSRLTQKKLEIRKRPISFNSKPKLLTFPLLYRAWCDDPKRRPTVALFREFIKGKKVQ